MTTLQFGFHKKMELTQKKVIAHTKNLVSEVMTTLQSTNNLLLSSLSGVTTLETSSKNTAINSIHNKKVINSYDCIYTSVKSLYRLLQLSFRYINLYTINYTFLALAKLFCLVGRNREYKSYLGSKYLLLDWFLVVNLPDYLTKQTRRGI